MNKSKWENIFMQLAELVASCSYDNKTKVGCVLVSEDYKDIYSTGYNAKAIGLENERYSSETGKSGFIHAEINALLRSLVPYTNKKIAFLTHKPCEICAQALINSNVKQIYYLHDYEGLLTDKIITTQSVELIKFFYRKIS